ncbi:MAG: hypothetical protein AAF330_01590 [Pseudomonadota bacterium]
MGTTVLNPVAFAQTNNDKSVTAQTNNAEAAQAIGTFEAAEAISEGDLLVLQEAGTVRKRVPGYLIARENQDHPGAYPGVAYKYLEGDLTPTSYLYAQKMCVLGNGNMACFSVSRDNDYPGFIIVDRHTGDRIGRPVVCEASALNRDIQFVRVDAESFAVVWSRESDNLLRFAVYSNEGVEITAPTTVGDMTGGGGTIRFGGAIVLADGLLAFAFQTSTNALHVTRFQKDGTQFGTPSEVHSSVANMSGMMVASASGGFYYLRTGVSNNDAFLSKWDASGDQVGSETTVTTDQLEHGNLGILAMLKRPKLCELSGGNVVVMHTTSTAPSGVYLNIFASDLSDVARDVRLASDTTDYAGGVFAKGDEIVAVTNGKMFVVSNAGRILQELVGLDPVGSHSTFSSVHFGWNGVNYVLCQCSSNNSNQTVRISILDTLDDQLRTITTLVSGQNYGSNACTFEIDPVSGLVTIFNFAHPTLQSYIGAYHTQRSSVIGVALGSAVKGEDVSVGLSGAFTLSEPDLGLGTFDASAAYVPGARGFVTGKTAFLKQLT